MRSLASQLTRRRRNVICQTQKNINPTTKIKSMTPALITLNYKYELIVTETNHVLKRIFDNCDSEFNNTKGFIATNFGIPNTTLFKDYPPELKNQLYRDLNRIVQTIMMSQDFVIPNLTDKSKNSKFKTKSVSFEIEDSNISTIGLVINLIFSTEPVILIGNIDKTLIIALEAFLNSLQDQVEIESLSLEYDKDLWIKTYKKL